MADNHPEMYSADDLTAEELRAINSLKRLAKKWPQSLTVLSMAGSMSVVRTDDERLLEEGSWERQQAIIADIDGIPNDGGDW